MALRQYKIKVMRKKRLPVKADGLFSSKKVRKGEELHVVAPWFSHYNREKTGMLPHPYHFTAECNSSVFLQSGCETSVKVRKRPLL